MKIQTQTPSWSFFQIKHCMGLILRRAHKPYTTQAIVNQPLLHGAQEAHMKIWL